jgi:hypothetical protein
MTKSKKKANIEGQGTLSTFAGVQKPVQASAVQQAKEPKKNHAHVNDHWLRDPELKAWLSLRSRRWGSPTLFRHSGRHHRIPVDFTGIGR